jgi:hypothetical protein
MATIFGLIGWIVPYSAFNLYEHSFYIGVGTFTFVLVASYIFLVNIVNILHGYKYLKYFLLFSHKLLMNFL